MIKRRVSWGPPHPPPTLSQLPTWKMIYRPCLCCSYTHLFNIVLLVEVPCHSICRKTYFVCRDPVWVQVPVTLSCHSTDRQHCTHVNLKPVCSGTRRIPGLPWSSNPLVPKSSTRCIKSSIERSACCHSLIWYFTLVIYTNGLTHWKKKKALSKWVINFWWKEIGYVRWVPVC